MDEVVARVLARLDEDERAALRATAGPWRLTDAENSWGDEEAVLAGPGDARPTCVAATGNLGDAQSAFDAKHIARWDPDRVLADVAAKRRIVKLYQNARAAQLAGSVSARNRTQDEAAVDVLGEAVRALDEADS